MWRKILLRKKKAPSDLTIVRIVNTLIERLAINIFESYAQKLVSEDVAYIIYAAWGVKGGGQLTETQKKIHEQIDPEVRAIYDSLKLEGLADSQSMAINSLIRGFLIFKILFMVEHLRNRLGYAGSEEHETVQEVLHHIRAIGSD